MLRGKMAYNKAKVGYVVAIAVVVALIGFSGSTGYGSGHSAISNQKYLAQQVKQYQPSHVDVIYERTISGKQDFLHLEIDTTYHKIGKGNYIHEVLCNRDYSLRTFDGKYHDCSKMVAQCFVEGSTSINWQATEATKTISGNKCSRVVAAFTTKSWEAWYTKELPYLAEGAKATDNYNGLILEVRDADGQYELKAKYITQYIG